MTPLPGFLGIALAFASQRIVGGLRDCGEAVLLHHLARNRLDLISYITLSRVPPGRASEFRSSRLPRGTAEAKVSFRALAQINFPMNLRRRFT